MRGEACCGPGRAVVLSRVEEPPADNLKAVGATDRSVVLDHAKVVVRVRLDPLHLAPVDLHETRGKVGGIRPLDDLKAVE